MTKIAQNWLDANYSDKKTVSEIKLGSVEELTGELLIKDYTKVEVIDFERWGKKTKDKITKVIIDNCPQIKKVKFNNNEISEITFRGTFNSLDWLDLPDNKLTKIDVSKFPNLIRLNVTRNPNLTEIEGWENLTKLEFFNLYDTPGLNGEAVKKWKDAINSALGATSKDEPLPNDWKNKLDGLKNRPTQEDLNKAVKQTEDKFKGYINPNNPADKGKLDQAAKNAGFVTKEEYNRVVNEKNNRPNIPLNEWNNDYKNRPSRDDYNRVKKDRDDRITNVTQQEYQRLLIELNNWKNKFPGKTPADVKKDLDSKPAATTLTPEQQQKLNNYENLRKQQERLLQYLNEEKSHRQYAQIIQDLKITIT